jgi:pimeloyl-ACP methyl ester carboxylesterase
MAGVQDAYVNRKAVLAHGAASSAAFIRRAFAGPLAGIGYEVVTWDRRTPAADAVDELAALVERSDATVVGGVSVGAILAARYALRPGVRLSGLLLALPPGDPAGPLLAEPAQRPVVDDITSLVEAASRGAAPWVAAEIRAAWPTYGHDELLGELRTAAHAVPPALAELARIDAPTGVVGLAGDPVHPLAVAEAWAQAIPAAAVETLALDEPAADVSVIGAAAVRAWMRARTLSGSQ